MTAAFQDINPPPLYMILFLIYFIHPHPIAVQKSPNAREGKQEKQDRKPFPQSHKKHCSDECIQPIIFFSFKEMLKLDDDEVMKLVVAVSFGFPSYCCCFKMSWAPKYKNESAKLYSSLCQTEGP